MSRDLFVTFGDGRRGFRLAAQRLVSEIQDSGWDADLLLLNDDSARERIGQDWINHEGWMKSTTRGHGLWVWKTIILKHALGGTFGNYHRVVYLDAGCQFSLKNEFARKRFNQYLEMVDTHGGMAFTHKNGQFGIRDFSDESWGKNHLHEAMAASPQTLKSNQILAGCLFLSPKIRSVIEDWSRWATKDNYKYLRDPEPSEIQIPSYLAHRHDQSILSILWKDAGLLTIPDETWFHPNWDSKGSGFPIWSIRNSSSFHLPSRSMVARFMHKVQVTQSRVLDKLYQ